MRANPKESADLVTFTEESLHGKLHFLCSETSFVQLSFYINLVLFEYIFTIIVANWTRGDNIENQSLQNEKNCLMQYTKREIFLISSI